MLWSVRSARAGLCAVAATALLGAVAAPARAADWLPTFGLGANDVSAVKMTPRGDIGILLNTSTGPALRFRPIGGPLGPLTHPFPPGASTASFDMDAAGNTYLAWTRADELETRVRRRSGALTPIQKVQAGAIGGKIAAARNGRAVLAWLSSDASRTGSVRTRAADGTLGRRNHSPSAARRPASSTSTSPPTAAPPWSGPPPTRRRTPRSRLAPSTSTARRSRRLRTSRPRHPPSCQISRWSPSIRPATRRSSGGTDDGLPDRDPQADRRRGAQLHPDADQPRIHLAGTRRRRG